MVIFGADVQITFWINHVRFSKLSVSCKILDGDNPNRDLEILKYRPRQI